MQALEMCSQSSQQNEIMLLPCNKTVGNVVSWQNLPEKPRKLKHLQTFAGLQGHLKVIINFQISHTTQRYHWQFWFCSGKENIKERQRPGF